MKQKTALELYTNKAYRIVMTVTPLVALASSVFFTACKVAGLYPTVNTVALGIFNVCCLFYIALARLFVSKAFDGEGNLIPAMLMRGKIFLGVLTIVHWNYISYMIPSVDFWGYGALFLLMSAFFFDEKMVLLEALGLIVSTFISWFIRGHALTSPDDGFYLQNMMMRILCIVLTYGSIWFMTKLCNSVFVMELEKVYDYDQLTGALNRRRLLRTLSDAESKYAKGKAYSIAYMDIDDFKVANDTYGHEFGDTVLAGFSNTVRQNLPEGASLFRMGGEEFMVLFPSGLNEAQKCCEQIRKSVEEKVYIPRQGVVYRITVTIGLREGRDDASAYEVMNEADDNLLIGKRNGKNQVVC